MREFSNEELANLLINKVKELKAEKQQSQELNEKLQENLMHLEEMTAKLEETEEELKKERDNLKLEVQRKTNELLKQEKLSAIGELSARIAHDLRNPLSVIKNSAALIKMGQKNMDSKTKVYWEQIERGIYRISHQVDDVLDFIRSSPLKKKPAKISTILHDACERTTIPHKIKINLPKIDVSIPCDGDKLETVFVNLIMNSIQAIGDKVGIVSISLVEESNDVLLITVKDTGPGIPHNLIPKIFDPLFTTRQIGTGLGLPSCKNIIEQHGGSIDVSSILGKGTTFLIRLPTKTEWENLSKIGDREKLSDYIASARNKI
ncbi:MAG: sensor histidine kinase [Nitrosopumilaceae archaeon]